ncbi:Yip1 family protein [Kroppenstedtia eburnea]|uniref:Yip1 family protein n=1 Tax=Kroppenstedtia eburnea TaxID=714067 RepID=UPI000399A5C7
MNPLKTIWLETRETIEERIEAGSRSQTILLIALFGISWMIGQAYLKDSGNDIPVFRIVVYALIVGPFVGAFFWFVISGLTYLTGRMFGGDASWRDLRTAVAWATIPYSATLLLWIPRILLFGQELFSEHTPHMDSSLLLLLLATVFEVVDLVMTVWFFIVLSKSIGTAHRISAWKGFFAFIIPFFPFIFLLVLLSLL